MQACRNGIHGLDLNLGAHAGLLLRKYLKVSVPQKGETEKRHPEARAAVLKSTGKAATDIYQHAFKRWQSSLPQPCESEMLHVQGRLIVGLGGENVLETGLTLHHTYGVPTIPGSALKGLAAHYAHTVWGAADDRWKNSGADHKTLFGAHDDAGHIVFHDAWITPDSLTGDGKSGLVLDVMTPHHGGYYAKKTYENGLKKGQLVPPTDFDDPNPVTFLSVAGSFLVAVSCDVSSTQGAPWATLAFDLLKEAMKEWGVGGKTSSGYGRMSEKKTAPAGWMGQTPKPNPPRPGAKVEGVLIEEKTKKDGWKAKHEPTGLSGPVQNTTDVPGDKKPGDKLTLIVASVSEREIAFRFPTAEDEQRAQKAHASPKPGPNRNQGGRSR